MKIATILFILICWFSIGHSHIINVPEDYSTIQEGIDASVDGDTVLVAPGNYREYNNLNGKNILLTSENGPDTTTTKQVIFSGGTDSTAVLKGFGFRGIGNYLSPIRINRNNSGIIEGNIVNGNLNWEDCGGIESWGADVIIRGNIITNNRAMYIGGGICANGSGFIITENIITNNIAGGDDESWGGGGIFSNGGSDFQISYNLISNNQAGYSGSVVIGGGGLQLWVSYNQEEALINNNTIVGNSCIGFSENRGSGLWISTGDSVNIVNNIFAFNQQGGISVDFPEYYRIDYNLAWQNDYGDHNFEIGPTNLLEDPLFVNPDSGNYSLQEDSPCIDAGDPNSPLDPDSTRADIGCYYYHHVVDVTDPDSSNNPHKFYLEQNYPNPFNGQTIISYYLPDDSDVELNIINMRGELVAKPVNSHQSAGNHSLIWQGTLNDGTPVATGIYFYELKVLNSYTPQSREVKAMILLK